MGGYRLTAFATSTKAGQLADLEVRHRLRARCEDRIRCAKDTGLDRFPLQGFDQNRIWCLIVALACDLLAFSQLLALADAPSLFIGLCKLLWKDWYWLLLLMMTTGRLLVGGMWSTGCAWLGLWMACLSRAGAGQVSMTGVDGLLPALHQGRPWRGGLAAWLERAPGLRQGRADHPGAW